jgi:hypothetical protein
VEYLLNRARSFIFSTAPVPAAAAAATAGVELIQSAEGAARRARLRENIRALRAALRRPDDPSASAIALWPVGEAAAATALAEALRACGIFAPAIRYPTVKRGAARLRFTASATHAAADFDALAAALVRTPCSSSGGGLSSSVAAASAGPHPGPLPRGEGARMDASVLAEPSGSADASAASPSPRGRGPG